MRKISLLILILLSSFFSRAQYTLTDKDIKEYEVQVQQMVLYLEETLNFIGDPSVPAKEKDIIFKDSYNKVFRDEEVQVEDDLDDNRGIAINKDVQAYLKDVDFFFDNVTFNFDIQSITPQTNDLGETFFKVSMVRTITGKTISGDSINNSKNRFLEINLDSYKKELKIVSFYTTKPNVQGKTPPPVSNVNKNAKPGSLDNPTHFQSSTPKTTTTSSSAPLSLVTTSVFSLPLSSKALSSATEPSMQKA